jgi:hypothetical protein
VPIPWTEIAFTIAWDFIKQLIQALPYSLDRWRFRRFFGDHALSGENIYAVVDPYTHPLPRVGNRYIKRFLGRQPDQPLIGEDNVLGVNVVRVVSYLSSTFSEYRRKTYPIAVVTDEQIADKWDGTFICFGSSDSNLKTFDIENLPEQNFYNFNFSPKGSRRFSIGGRHFSGGQGKDYGVLLRIKNPRHPEHYLFVCAGLGEWGTSGTAYYLFDCWKEISKRFKREDFCMIIEVDLGSDESAREVYSVSR